MPERSLGPVAAPSVAAYAPRERSRDVLRRAFPKRRGKVTFVRGRVELLVALRTALFDAVVIDLGAPAEDAAAVTALAREFPSIPFVGYAAWRPTDLPGLSSALAAEFADVIAEGAEDELLRELLEPIGYTARFATVLQAGAVRLGLATPLQVAAWRFVVAQGGRTVRTESIAQAVGLTREHLSRRFAADGAPNLKRVIDLVRLLAAADLAKNPGYDLPDIARVLGFASASHLSASCQRLLGVKSGSLARLRPADLMDRFVKQGRSRSRS